MGNKIIDHSDVEGASVGVALTTSALSTLHWIPWLGKANSKTRWETFKFGV